MLEVDSKKNEMETGDENCHITEREMVDKAAEWNPELSSKYRTNRAIGRPRKRWEDDINKFLKQVVEETENLTESSNQINKNMDQHSKRPRKMDSTRRKLHNDFRRKTRKYENEKKFS